MLVQILKSLIYLTVFLVPLIPASLGLGFEAIKVVIFLCLTITSGLIFVYLLQKNQLSIHWSRIKIAGLIFLICLSLTSISGINPPESVLGKYPYYQGLVLYWFLFLFFLMVSESGVKLLTLSKVITFSALFVAIIAIYQFAQINILNFQIPTYAGRVVSTFGQPNFYSGFLLLSLPLTYYLFSKSAKMINIYLLILFINLIGIVVSFSRIAVVLAIFFIGFLVFKALPKISRVLLALLLVLLVSIWVFISLKNPSGVIYQEILQPKTNLWLLNNSPEKRVLIWPVILELILQKPFLGYGLDNLSRVFSEYLNAFNPVTTVLSPEIFSLKNLKLDRSHSYILDLLIFSGSIGLLSYLVLILLVFLKIRNKGSCIWVLFLYLVWTQFQNQSIVHLIIFWAIVGVIDNSAIIKHHKS